MFQVYKEQNCIIIFKIYFDKKILVNGHSSVVVSVLTEAVARGYQIEVFAVESRPKCDGIDTY
jgi:translation initiation factor 2B subunit (eIF-2B alpha/beta/delta family)